MKKNFTLIVILFPDGGFRSFLDQSPDQKNKIVKINYPVIPDQWFSNDSTREWIVIEFIPFVKMSEKTEDGVIKYVIPINNIDTRIWIVIKGGTFTLFWILEKARKLNHLRGIPTCRKLNGCVIV